MGNPFEDLTKIFRSKKQNVSEKSKQDKTTERESHSGLDENIENLDQIKKKEKAEELLGVLKDVVGELLCDEQNAILRYSKISGNRVLDQYVEDLVKENSPVFYLDTSGIIRAKIYKKQLNFIDTDGNKMPSKIKDKTISERWSEIKDKYELKISELSGELNIE